ANGFDVSASHTYDRRSSYPLAVQIENWRDNTLTVVGSYASILAQDDHAAVQTVLGTSLVYSGGIDGGTSEGSGAYSAGGGGSYEYTYTISLVDGLYETVTTTYTGSLNFTLGESGQEGSSTFTIDSYNLWETGSISVHRDVAGDDLEGSYTSTEDGSITVSSRTKNGSDSAGNYIFSTNLSTSLALAEDGIYGGQT